MRTTDNVLKEMDRLLDEYTKSVEKARDEKLVSSKTCKTYTYHPTNFIRWCKGEFQPGEKNSK